MIEMKFNKHTLMRFYDALYLDLLDTLKPKYIDEYNLVNFRGKLCLTRDDLHESVIANNLSAEITAIVMDCSTYISSLTMALIIILVSVVIGTVVSSSLYTYDSMLIFRILAILILFYIRIIGVKAIKWHFKRKFMRSI